MPDQWGTRASYSPSGRFIGVAAGRHVAIVSPEGELVRNLGQLRSTVSDLAWSPKIGPLGRESLAATCYGGLTLWQTDTNKPKRFEWKGSSLVLSWSPDGRYIATGDQDSTVHFWIVRRAEDLQMSGYAMKVKELAWSPDSLYLATGGGGVITVWDCSGKGPAGTRPISLEGHESKINAIAFMQADSSLASGDEAGRVIFWSLSEESSSTSLELDSAVSTLTWSNDDELLAIGTANGTLHCGAAHA